MPEYTLSIRRYSPETGEPAYWEDFRVELDGHRSVLDGILQAKDREDGSIGIRCSCRAAICGSCGVRINGRPGLACHMHLEQALKYSRDGETIPVEPMGNMPVIRDLITDMDAVHWKKIRRVTPWLLPDGPPPEREYIVPKESMVEDRKSTRLQSHVNLVCRLLLEKKNRSVGGSHPGACGDVPCHARTPALMQ